MSTIDVGKIKFTWRGIYDAATTYEADDLVYFGGSSWVCVSIEEVTGTEPIIQVAAVVKEETAPGAANGRILVRPQFKSRKAAEVFITDANAKLAASTVEAALEELYDKTQTHEDPPK